MRKRKRVVAVSALIGCVALCAATLLVLLSRDKERAAGDAGPVYKVEVAPDVEEDTIKTEESAHVPGFLVAERCQDSKSSGEAVLVASYDFLELTRDDLGELGLEEHAKYSVLVDDDSRAQEITTGAGSVPLKFLNFGSPVPEGILYRYGEDGHFVTDGEMAASDEEFPYESSPGFVHPDCAYAGYTVFDTGGYMIGMAYVESECRKGAEADE